jgi:prepilin-type N-terminal cleavage/methylation domain-containing protein
MKNLKLKYLSNYPRIKKAMTLTELLVASILISIVMIGAVSIDYAIRRSRNSISSSTLMATQISAAMKQITRDAGLAVGDITNPGIVFDNTLDDINICFRIDSPGTPGNYTDDTWTCYSQGDSSPGHTEKQIYRCAEIVNGNELGANQFCSSAVSETFVLETRALGFFNIPTMPDIEFTLRRCADNDSAVTEHPINNPCYELESQISPPGISR